MNEQIKQILSQITHLEDELHQLIREQQVEFNYRIEGTKVLFEKNFRQAQLHLKTGIFRFLRNSQPRNILSAPVIYSVIVPIVLLDIWITLYQAMCFPLYRVPKARRADYVVIDRHSLPYLNSIEKLNCIYCGYCAGVFAYAREISARTEQYWCPIKHARKLLDPHRRYAQFADYGLGEQYHQISTELRAQLRAEND